MKQVYGDKTLHLADAKLLRELNVTSGRLRQRSICNNKRKAFFVYIKSINY
jgi:hypothetical protein